jgi:aspartate aminotransferase
MARVRKEKFQVNLNLNVRGLAPSATLAINEKSNELLSSGRKVFKLGLGQSPFPVPDSVVKALQHHAHEKDYLPVKGLKALREAVSYFNMRHQHVMTDPDDVLIGPGSKELIFLLQLVYYGDLIIPTPSWVSYSPQAHIVGRHVTWVPTVHDNNLRLSPERLDLICRTDPERPRLVILNYPANPTGCTYPIDRLKQLASVARKYKVILVSDEIYGLTHHHDQHVSIARFYPEGTIISSGLSKWCGAGGWRLGTFSFPPDLKWLMNAMAIVASETFTATSAPIQYAAVTAFNGNEEIDHYLAASRRVLRTILKYILEKLDQMKATYPMPQGAFYVFPDFGHYREKLNQVGIFTSVEMCARILQETGVAMLPGSDFGRQPEEFSVRMAYVDFDGKAALNALWHAENGKSPNSRFVKDYCPRLVEAMERLGEWFWKL